MLIGQRQLFLLIDGCIPIKKDLSNRFQQNKRSSVSNAMLEKISSNLLQDYYLLYDKLSLVEDLRYLYSCCSFSSKSDKDFAFLLDVANKLSSKLIGSSAEFQIHPEKLNLFKSDVLYDNLCSSFSYDLLERYFVFSDKFTSKVSQKALKKNRLAILTVIAPSCPELKTTAANPKSILKFFK